MGRIIAIANQKGGVGKTTTAINLAFALASSDRRVLLIDLDPQGNATSGLLSPNQLNDVKTSKHTIYEALINGVSAKAVLRQARETLCIAPSGPDLVGAEIELATSERREARLAELIKEIRKNFSFILIDTPPSLGLLTLNALVAADAVLVPMQCEYYALEGLSALLGTISRVRQALNQRLKIEGVVLTMYDARNRLSHEIAREVAKHLPNEIFQTVIPRNVRLSESPSHGLAAAEYDPRSPGAEAYRELAAELLARLAGTSHALVEPPDAAEANSGPSSHRKSWSLRALFARGEERSRKKQ